MNTCTSATTWLSPGLGVGRRRNVNTTSSEAKAAESVATSTVRSSGVENSRSASHAARSRVCHAASTRSRKAVQSGAGCRGASCPARADARHATNPKSASRVRGTWRIMVAAEALK